MLMKTNDIQDNKSSSFSSEEWKVVTTIRQTLRDYFAQCETIEEFDKRAKQAENEIDSPGSRYDKMRVLFITNQRQRLLEKIRGHNDVISKQATMIQEPKPNGVELEIIKYNLQGQNKSDQIRTLVNFVNAGEFEINENFLVSAFFNWWDEALGYGNGTLRNLYYTMAKSDEKLKIML